MNKQLSEWTIHYVKNKDLTFKKLVKFTEKEDIIDFEFKDKHITYLIVDVISENIFKSITNKDHKVIVCQNIEENFKFLIKNWNRLSDISNLSILFVNLKINDKWLINPHTHSMIADPSTIESGLRTMFDTANGKATEIKTTKKKSSMFEEGSVMDEEEAEED